MSWHSAQLLEFGHVIMHTILLCSTAQSPLLWQKTQRICLNAELAHWADMMWGKSYKECRLLITSSLILWPCKVKMKYANMEMCVWKRAPGNDQRSALNQGAHIMETCKAHTLHTFELWRETLECVRPRLMNRRGAAPRMVLSSFTQKYKDRQVREVACLQRNDVHNFHACDLHLTCSC